MKLFKDFEAVKFHEENLIFVTSNSYLYYIYDKEYKHWRKHSNAGNDCLTVKNYDEVSREELMDAMGGIFPKKETDFMRLCNPEGLWIRDLIDLLIEDYHRYMSDGTIRYTVRQFLLESDVCHKSYTELRKLFDEANLHVQNNENVLASIKELCLTFLGRDIFKEEICIVDGHNSSSYFGIIPVRIIDYSSTIEMDNVAKMRSVEISIEEDDVWRYLAPFLYKYFDEELDANKQRIEYTWKDEDGNERISSVKGFEWYLTHNYFTHESIKNVLKDISNTIDVLSSGRDNEFTEKFKDVKPELVIDFYSRFAYRMEYMLRVSEEKGYNLISFMGP